MSRLRFVVILLGSCMFFSSCSKDGKDETKESCTDGVKNQNETGVDCGGTCQPCEYTYFVKYQMDGTDYHYGRDVPSECFTTSGVCWVHHLNLQKQKYVEIEIDFNSNGEVHEADILSLEGKTMSFEYSSQDLFAQFKTYKKDSLLRSAWANDHSNSELTVEKVTPDGTAYQGYKAFILEGNFSTPVADQNGSESYAIDNAEFAIRVAEFY